MTKILLNKNGKALINEEGQVYKGLVEKEFELENNTITGLPSNYLDASSKVTSFKSESVTTYFGGSTFQNAVNLKSVYTPNAKKLGYYSFQNCTSLKNVYAPLAENIESNCFDGCSSLEVLDFPSVISINEGAFKNCVNLKTLNLPSLEEIPKRYVFDGCSNLEVLDFPKLTSIEYNVFENMANLKKISFQSLTSIGVSINNNSLYEAYLPNLIETSFSMFSRSKNLQIVDISNATKLKTACFSDCTSLKTINLPKVANIDSQSFARCTPLTDVYLGYDGLVVINSSAFYNAGKGKKVHVRSAYADQYATATNWVDLINDGTIIIVGDYTD